MIIFPGLIGKPLCILFTDSDTITRLYLFYTKNVHIHVQLLNAVFVHYTYFKISSISMYSKTFQAVWVKLLLQK